MFKAKILVIGPSESGKTALSDFLSDATETIGGEYRPTQGVRILEFESQTLDASDKNATLDVELWDCAGDFKFESCWPALMRDSNGGMQESQCLLIAHHKPGSSADRGHPALASHLSKLSMIHSNLEEDPEQMRQAFRRYLGSIVRMMSESREREEMSIIT
ncbi:intraflagellar transport protein 22 homolog isoform X2 [Paramormyrops kingsleyae]|uniref:intraflagellar transport protein 22 homolog isoform X2 n=1 Tax=Paramormyrops kingsleyae TaxID=1676925 RepID=UPI000CD6412D|nr:intraflagellar transport protein 22 homolog isoform X2 [Paramormyrops kingsleyae]